MGSVGSAWNADRMTIIVNKGNGIYEKLESANNVSVTNDGSLVLQSTQSGRTVAAYAAGNWVDAVTAGDYSRVDGAGEPIA
jgi:hypothetical protein